MEEKKTVFETLNAINVNEHTEKKNNLTYLSWAWAWGIVKKNYPLATYDVYEDERGLNYFTDGRTCYVKVGVTIENLELIEFLPVMDFRNASIPLEKVTSFDVNKAIQRCLTKAIARHGLGLYIYAGEDLPEDETQQQPTPKQEPKQKAPNKAQETPKKAQNVDRQAKIAEIIKGSELSIDRVEAWSKQKFNKSIAELTNEEFQFVTEKLSKQLSK